MKKLNITSAKVRIHRGYTIPKNTTSPQLQLIIYSTSVRGNSIDLCIINGYTQRTISRNLVSFALEIRNKIMNRTIS